jgi:flagellar basal body-associated protein FliL
MGRVRSKKVSENNVLIKIIIIIIIIVVVVIIITLMTIIPLSIRKSISIQLITIITHYNK